MNYLELALVNAQKGIQGPISHIGVCIGLEQLQVSKAVAEKGFWFVDIPRTSSSSIQYMMGRQFGFPFGKAWIPEKGDIEGLSSNLLPPHTLAYQAREVVGREVWQSANTFSVVRDPYTWSVSLWGYARTINNLGLKIDTFELFLQSMQSRLVGAKEQRELFPSNFSQSDYLTDHQGSLLVNKILKFEDRDSINEHLNSLGVENILTDKLVASSGNEYVMTDRERSLVRNVFAKDFEYFSY
jgi:hypothetical protein